MIELEAIEYLGIGKGGRMTHTEMDIALVDYAESNGFILDSDESRILNMCYRFTRTPSEAEAYVTSFVDTVIVDLRRIAASALVWLNDRGILPRGYSQDPIRSDDGFGFAESHAARRRANEPRLGDVTRLSGAAGGAIPGMGMGVGK